MEIFELPIDRIIDASEHLRNVDLHRDIAGSSAYINGTMLPFMDKYVPLRIDDVVEAMSTDEKLDDYITKIVETFARDIDKAIEKSGANTVAFGVKPHVKLHELRDDAPAYILGYLSLAIGTVPQ